MFELSHHQASIKRPLERVVIPPNGKAIIVAGNSIRRATALDFIRLLRPTQRVDGYRDAGV